MRNRQHIVDTIETLTRDRHDVAFRGTPGAVNTWTRSTSRKDLDVWVHSSAAQHLHDTLTRAGAVHVGATHASGKRANRWLFTVTTLSADSPTSTPHVDDVAVIDVLIGNYTIASRTLLPEHAITVGDDGHYTSDAAATDIITRRLYAGKLPTPIDLAWLRTRVTDTDLHTITAALAPVTGHKSARHIAAAITGTRVAPTRVWTRAQHHARRARVRDRLETLSTVAGWHDAPNWVPTCAVAGMNRRGLTCVVGVDGAGKSTTVHTLTAIAAEHGWKPVSVYAGMIRANTWPLRLARAAALRHSNALTTASTTGTPAPEPEPEPTATVTRQVPGRQRSRVLRTPTIRTLRAWAYTLDYLPRTWSARLRAHHRFVITDRWCVDLDATTCIGARTRRRLYPRIDTLIGLTVTATVAATRKPEHTPDELAAAHTANLSAWYSANTRQLVIVDTSTSTTIDTSAAAWNAAASICPATCHRRPQAHDAPIHDDTPA